MRADSGSSSSSQPHTSLAPSHTLSPPPRGSSNSSHPSSTLSGSEKVQSANNSSSQSHSSSQSVDKNQGPGQPISTSTVIDKPETTLTSPVFSSVTDSNGRASLSVPPLVTSLGISSNSDGSYVTVTHIEANPTGIFGVSDTSTVKNSG